MYYAFVHFYLLFNRSTHPLVDLAILSSCVCYTVFIMGHAKQISHLVNSTLENASFFVSSHIPEEDVLRAHTHKYILRSAPVNHEYLVSARLLSPLLRSASPIIEIQVVIVVEVSTRDVPSVFVERYGIHSPRTFGQSEGP